MNVCIIELIKTGGMVHYASQLCNSLAFLGNGINVSIIAPDGLNEAIFNDKVTVNKIPSVGRHGYRIDLIIKHILATKPDIIHITVIHPFIIPLLSTLKKVAPIVLTVHDVILHSDQQNFVVNMTTNIISRYADMNFVHSEKLKSELSKKRITDSKIAVVPHGDYSFFNNLGKEEIIEEENIVLFFGRILKYKGIDYLIKSEPLISSKIPNFKIVIAGDGDFSPYKKLIKNQDNFVIINEYIPDERVPELFQKASVVVLPYIEASQSGIIPIAYSFKKPVIATDVGSLSEVVINGVTGFIVPPSDIHELANAIIEILSNKNIRKNMGDAAYEFMIKEMSWNEVAKKTFEEYIKLTTQDNRQNQYGFNRSSTTKNLSEKLNGMS